MLVRHLPLVEGAHVANGVLDSVSYQNIERLMSAFYFLTTNAQLIERQSHPIKAFSKLQQCLVAALAHLL